MSDFSLDFAEWCRLLLDPQRVDAHSLALQSAIRPGDIVVDIGAGIGIFSLLACRYGARKVYAIDSKPMIHLGRELAAANGCAERIEFIQNDSRHVSLPEAANLIVCDVRSALPEQQVPVLIDARRRLLTPGGTLVPRADRLWAAVVHAPARHDALIGIWKRHPQGWKANAAYRRSPHAWLVQRMSADELISAPACFATIDYQSAADGAGGNDGNEGNDGNIAGAFVTQAPHGATGHGLCVWFDADLGNGVSFSNRPQQPCGDRQSSNAAAFFPWPEEIRFETGDLVSVRFKATLSTRGYRWRWETVVTSGAGIERVRFDQDTNHHSDDDERAPAASRLGDSLPRRSLAIDRYVLSAMDRGLTISAIASGLAETFPHAFASQDEALTYTGGLSVQYG